jgi:hypothetical protein
LVFANRADVGGMLVQSQMHEPSQEMLEIMLILNRPLTKG